MTGPGGGPAAGPGPAGHGPASAVGRADRTVPDPSEIIAPTGLVLAAGAGTRLGRGPKALLRHRGATLVEHVVRALRGGGCAEIVVVVGAEAGRVESALTDRGDQHAHPAVRCVRNPDWARGMGTSLQVGLRSVGPGRDVLITPVDRPGLRAEAVARVIAAHRPGEITAAAHLGDDEALRRGHPVLLDARWTADAAASAHGDVGARGLLRDRHEIVQLVDCSDLDDGGDLDTPADLWRLERGGRYGAPRGD